MKNIPETDESKLLKLLYMTTNEKINYFDTKDSKINKINLELEIIEKCLMKNYHYILKK